MFVRGLTADKLFESAKKLPGPRSRTIVVPKPEHLIAMKVQAMKDAPERTWQDLVDAIDLQRDVPTTAADIEILRRLRRETPAWFSLSTSEFEALVPEDALDRHPVISAGAHPFTLP